MTPFPLFLVALAALSLGFAGVFLVARRLDNYGIVDVAWSLGLFPVAVMYGILGDGMPGRRIFAAILASLWSLRLGGFLAVRVLGKIHSEDGRYGQLRKDWADGFTLKMFAFFQAQAVLLSILSLPFLFPSFNAAGSLHALEWLGGGLCVVSVAGEGIADLQLAAFKRLPENRGRVCDRGLWRWSRHPNYFFEAMTWISFSLFACASPFGWVAAVCPFVMLFFLLRVTGIRYTEDHLLRSKGDAYRVYQNRTSAFVPLPPSLYQKARSLRP